MSRRHASDREARRLEKAYKAQFRKQKTKTCTGTCKPESGCPCSRAITKGMR